MACACSGVIGGTRSSSRILDFCSGGRISCIWGKGCWVARGGGCPAFALSQGEGAVNEWAARAGPSLRGSGRDSCQTAWRTVGGLAALLFLFPGLLELLRAGLPLPTRCNDWRESHPAKPRASQKRAKSLLPAMHSSALTLTRR